MSKKELQRELKNVKNLYVVGIKKGTNPKWDKGIWRAFRVYYIKGDELKQVLIDRDERNKPNTWNEKKNFFEVKSLGVNRAFEIVYNLGLWLFNDGYKFREHFLSWE